MFWALRTACRKTPPDCGHCGRRPNPSREPPDVLVWCAYAYQEALSLVLAEIRNLPSPVELLFVAGQRPMIARKIYYFEDREFAGMFDQA